MCNRDYPIRRHMDSYLVTLSPREREVLTLVVRDGMSDKRIAKHLGLSYWTVRGYINQIMLRYPSEKRPRAAFIDLYMMLGKNGDAINSG